MPQGKGAHLELKVLCTVSLDLCNMVATSHKELKYSKRAKVFSSHAQQPYVANGFYCTAQIENIFVITE